MDHAIVRDMGKKKRPGLSPAAAEEGILDSPYGEEHHGKNIYSPVVFSSNLEFVIVFFCIAYSLFCLDAYLLNAVHLKLSVINLSFLLIAELALIAGIARKKITLIQDIRTTLFGILVLLVSLGISMKISPSFLPNNWSVDYPNHYILIDFLSTHEQLPLLTSGLGEMVQYPFGPSLFTSVIAKIIAMPLMITTGFLAAVIPAFIAVIVYLLARELLRHYPVEKNLADAAALISPFLVFSVPVYFLDQYSGNFYYSMMFGELLVLLSLLALMKVEKGNASWIFIFLVANLGIIFTYTLFIVIPVLAFIVFTILNPDLVRTLVDRGTILTGLLVALVFVLFSFERLTVGSGILQHEGLTVEFDILNFNLIFIILVVSGILVCRKMMAGSLRSALFAFYFVITAEFFAFLVLDRFGIIAMYYANKVFYLLILVLPVSAGLPVIYAIRNIRKDQTRMVALAGIIVVIFLFSLVIALSYPLNTRPVVTNEDVIFTQKSEAYLQANNIPYQNLSITTGELKGYWLGLLLHMDKNYAQEHFLTHPTPFDDWLKNPDATYVVGEMVNASYPEFFEMKGVRLQIVVREGQKVLIKKVE
jgi:hypothetical protein